MVRNEKHRISVFRVLDILGVSKSGYDAFLKRDVSQTEMHRNKVKKAIKQVYAESKEIYGAPKIYKKLKKQGLKASLRTVSVYMKQMGIHAHYVKKTTQTTINSDLTSKLINHVDRNFRVDQPNAVWVTDITYIWTRYDRFVYLTSVMDLYSRKIIAWELTDSLAVICVTECIRKAKVSRKIDKPLIIHSDRGSHYISQAYLKLFNSHMTPSYSKQGDPWDNACIESFHALIKREWLKRFDILNLPHAKALVFEYIEAFYNTQRIHGTLDYLTPLEFERQYQISETAKLSLKS